MLGVSAIAAVISKVGGLVLKKPFFPVYEGDRFRFVIEWYYALVFIAIIGIAIWLLFLFLDHEVGPPSRWVERYKCKQWLRTERERFTQLYRAMHGTDPPPGCEPSTLSLGMEYGGELGDDIEAKWRQTLKEFDRFRSEGQYLKGKRIGHWVFWHHNGRRLGEGAYIDGRPSGEWIFWKEDGTVSERSTYENGHLVKDEAEAT